MADPIFGTQLLELVDGDSLGYLRQNDRNLVISRLAIIPRVLDSGLSTPPGTVNRGEMWIVGNSPTDEWANAATDSIAIARSDDPSSEGGWVFLPMDSTTKGVRVYIEASFGARTGTGHRWWTGSAWALF